MKIFNVTPRSFCQGVIDAITIAKKTIIKYPGQKITILGMIVHNQFVMDELANLGINILNQKNQTRLQLLDQVNEGVVIITAHGAGPDVFAKAKQKELIIEDATCSYISKIHSLIIAKLYDNYQVYFLGNAHHPETEGVLALSSKIHLITNSTDLPTTINHKSFITNQTTLSYDQVTATYLIAKQRGFEIANEICDATRVRQNALHKIPQKTDIIIVIGDYRSHNTHKLWELALQLCPNSYKISSLTELKFNWFKNKQLCAITAGASTPMHLIQEVMKKIKSL